MLTAFLDANKYENIFTNIYTLQLYNIKKVIIMKKIKSNLSIARQLNSHHLFYPILLVLGVGLLLDLTRITCS